MKLINKNWDLVKQLYYVAYSYKLYNRLRKCIKFFHDEYIIFKTNIDVSYVYLPVKLSYHKYYSSLCKRSISSKYTRLIQRTLWLLGECNVYYTYCTGVPMYLWFLSLTSLICVLTNYKHTLTKQGNITLNVFTLHYLWSSLVESLHMLHVTIYSCMTL